MFETIKSLKLQKNQLIKDIRAAEPKDGFRGLPSISCDSCDNCNECVRVCPTNAINIDGKNSCIDLGKCTLCGECAHVCKKSAICFSKFHKLGTANREDLFVNGKLNPIIAKEEIKKFFGKSLKLRQVSAGGCNSCEMELNACGNANFDMGRYGVEFVASPRHADGIVITGPITKNMAKALEDTYLACSSPKIIVLVGACAISGSVFADSSELDRSFLDKYKPDLYIPGCPAHPLTIITAIIDFIGAK